MITKALSGFRKAKDGVSAVEFALILPIFVTMFMGIFEISNYVMVARRVSALASTAADLVAQETAVDTADINEVFNTIAIVGAPMASTGVQIAITSVVADTNGTTNRVAWSDARNRSARTVNSVLSTSEFPSGLLQANQGAIMVEVAYTYTPLFSGFIPEYTIGDTFYLKPRRSVTVTRL